MPAVNESIERIGSITLEGRLESMDDKLEKLLEREHASSTAIALIQDKLELHDKILMGVCGLVGTGVIIALIDGVVHV